MNVKVLTTERNSELGSDSFDGSIEDVDSDINEDYKTEDVVECKTEDVEYTAGAATRDL